MSPIVSLAPFKTLEVRDRGTHIPVVVFRMVAENPIQEYYIHYRGGHPRDGSSIVLMDINNMQASNDPYGWPASACRTLPVAHDYIIKHFDDLNDGDVVDVEYILGESQAKKVSERLTSEVRP